MSQGLVLHRGALGGDGLVENEGGHEDALADALACRRHGPRAFDTSEHLRGRAEVEAPRVVLVGVHGGVGSVRRDGSLEVGEAVGVEAAANFGGVADDLELVPGADIGSDASDLPAGHAEARHVLLRARLPSRRKAAVEDAEVVRARRARVGLGALGHDVVHQVGHANDRLVQLCLKIRAPVRRPPLLVAGPF